jgi:predicted TIM-barrel fold metal-dependent hydrolase
MTLTTGSPPPAGIDVQAHLLVPSYAAAAQREAAEHPDWAASHGTVAGQAPDAPAVVLEGRVAEMEAAGIGVSVISVPAVIFRSEARAVAAAHESNRELLEVSRSDPAHFRVMASLPMPHVDACLAELAELAEEPLVAALIMPAGTADWSLEEEHFHLLWEAIAEAGLPTILHPALEPWPPGFRKWRLGPGIGVPVEVSLAALHLILGGVLDRFPELDLIVPQLGGVLPYLTQRLIDRGQGDAAHDVGYYIKHRLYYDNNSYHRPALQCLLDTAGADRIMLGSDFPFRGTLKECVEDISRAGLDDAERDQILAGTARTLLRNLSTAP